MNNKRGVDFQMSRSNERFHPPTVMLPQAHYAYIESGVSNAGASLVKPAVKTSGKLQFPLKAGFDATNVQARRDAMRGNGREFPLTYYQ